MHRGNLYWLLLRISRFISHGHEQLIMAGGESTLARNNLLSCNLDSKMHVILLFEVRFPWSSTRNAANNVNFQRLHEPACDLAESQRNQLWVLRLCRFLPSFTTGCEGGYLAPDADFSTMVLAMWAASFLCYFEVRLILSLYYSHRANEKNQDYFPLDLRWPHPFCSPSMVSSFSQSHPEYRPLFTKDSLLYIFLSKLRLL